MKMFDFLYFDTPKTKIEIKAETIHKTFEHQDIISYLDIVLVFVKLVIIS